MLLQLGDAVFDAYHALALAMPELKPRQAVLALERLLLLVPLRVLHLGA